MPTDPVKEPLFTCEHLAFAYDEGEQVLKDISFRIRPGEKIVLLGRNGSGKSTLFKLMMTVLKKSRGDMYWRGQPYSRKRAFLNQLFRQVGFVFQDPDDQLFAATVEQEVSFGAFNLGLPEAEVRDRVDRALAATNCGSMRRKALEALSFGERKRVSIADLLVMDSQLLLLDEPTAWLDNTNSGEITAVLNHLHEKGMTFLCSTHDVNWAYSFAERVLVLEQGRLAFDGPATDFFMNPERVLRLGLNMPDVVLMHRLLSHYADDYAPTTLPRTVDAILNALPGDLGTIFSHDKGRSQTH